MQTWVVKHVPSYALLFPLLHTFWVFESRYFTPIWACVRHRVLPVYASVHACVCACLHAHVDPSQIVVYMQELTRLTSSKTGLSVPFWVLVCCTSIPQITFTVVFRLVPTSLRASSTCTRTWKLVGLLGSLCLDWWIWCALKLFCLLLLRWIDVHENQKNHKKTMTSCIKKETVHHVFNFRTQCHHIIGLHWISFTTEQNVTIELLVQQLL